MENDQNLFLYSSEKFQDSTLPILSFLQKNDLKNLHQSKDVSRVWKMKQDYQSYKNPQNNKRNSRQMSQGPNQSIINSLFMKQNYKEGLFIGCFRLQFIKSLLKALDESLSKNLKSKVQKFPGLKVFGKLEQEFILRRAKQLNIYLKSLIRYGNQEKTIQNFLKESQEAAIVKYDPDQIDYSLKKNA